ncbi:MAG: class I SAM-dependent methyltransferase, partial [Microbacterium chocolatum]|nr:class I SAM-dependent methyltransferase [Microbacterium chocolatum]
MDMAELTALLTPDGLRLLDEIPTVGSADDVARTVSRLRAAGHSPDLVSAVVGQARLRARAKTKFGDFASRMLFTRAGLEQATRLSIAARHAGRFRDAGIRHVFDLGCGIGGDALGLAALGMTVDAVDADEVTAAIAAYNLAPFGTDVRVRNARAEETVAELGPAAPEATAAWLDPARRTAGHSETARTRPEDWSPSLE